MGIQSWFESVSVRLSQLTGNARSARSGKNRRRIPKSPNPVALESRALLAAAPVSLAVGTGNLEIFGTPVNDICEIRSVVKSGIPSIQVTSAGKSQFVPKVLIPFNNIIFHGAAGDDTCTNYVADMAFYAYGEAGNDVLIGSSGVDVMRGGLGNDFLDGLEGNDFLYGDASYATSLQDALALEKGRDTLYGGAGDDNLYGGALGDSILGGTGDDYIISGSGDDTVYAGDGNDYVLAGWGNDRLYGDAGSDTLDGQENDDVVYGRSGFDFIYGGDGDDFLDAGADGGTYHGGAGVDCRADQPVIGGHNFSDISQNGSSSCWFLATLGAMATLGETKMNEYLSYKGEGEYNVRIYDYKKKKWTTQTIRFEGVKSTHPADARVIERGDRIADNAACEGEFWATAIHRGMLNYYKVDYMDASKVQNANYGYGAGAGGIPKNALLLLGNTSAKGEGKSSSTPFNAAFLNRMNTLLYRSIPVQPMIVGSVATPTSSKIVGTHAYQVTEIGSTYLVLRNPWGKDGGSGGDGVDDGYVTVTYAEFASNFNYVAYTTAVVGA